MSRLETFLEKITIRQILLLALLFRIVAAIFSKGYAFHDDHFEMAELVEKWRLGLSFLWTGTDVHVFSLIYPGFMYLIFEACRLVGITDPDHLLLVIRVIQALISLLTVYYAYKLSLRITSRTSTAKLVALCMALLWIFPFFSVRTLREFFCVPFLLMGSYYIADTRNSIRSIGLAALFFALAFSIRLQILFIPAGIGACMLFYKSTLRKALYFGIAFFIALLLTQGLFDYIYYGNPLASLQEYIRFNADPANIEIQPQGPFYQYIGTVAGVVWGLPFILLCWGYIYSFRLSLNAKMLLAGSLLFFIFHSYYSNKQERFILPFIPYFLILGIAGFREYYFSHKQVKWLKPATRFIVIWFLILNTAGLFVLSFAYSKRSRVEAMLYLREKGDVTNIVVEGIDGIPRPPLFYLEKQFDSYTFNYDNNGTDSLSKWNTVPGTPVNPNYVLMVGDRNLPERLERVKKMFPAMKHEADFAPGFVDNLAYRLNPKHNQNEAWHVYKIY